MRLVIIGPNSFIAGHVRDAARAANVPMTTFARVAEMGGQVGAGDVVMNFTLHPDYRSKPYCEDADCDLAAAQLARKSGAHFVMLSTRRVYPAESRWNAREDSPAGGDETVYGRNKAVTEAAVRALDDSGAIFRLANIFGMEFEAGAPRRTFFGLMLRSLKEEGVIRFDMSRATRRDFIPVEICARGLVQGATSGVCGTFNLGSGLGTPCGTLAQWVMAGYGGGAIEDQEAVKDEFFLNMEAWNSRFDPLLDAAALEDYCKDVGRKLKCAKS